MTAVFFPSFFEEVIFWAAFISWVGYFAIRAVLAQLRNKTSAKKTEPNRLANLPNVALVIIFVAVWLGYARIGPLPNWLFYPGIALVILGTVISHWAISVLGRFYNQTVTVMSNHRLIDRGPYRLIRHPQYTGMLLGILGFALALQSWAAILLLFVGGSLLFWVRMYFEERFLLTHLGDEYARYYGKTKRLIPFIL